jgi:hypothetical protein
MAHTPGSAVIPGGQSPDGSRRSRADNGGRRTPRITLDDTSKRIIEQLQQDGRRSYAAIGKAVGPVAGDPQPGPPGAERDQYRDVRLPEAP